MPLYRFQAVDAEGQSTGGTLDAPSPGHVARTLADRGLQVKSVRPADLVAQPSVTPAPVVAASRPVVSTSSPAVGPVFHTGRAKNSELSFLFLQIGSLWRAAVAPTVALTQLAAQERNPAIAQALRHMASHTAERGSLAEAMAAFPDVFPEGAVGAIAAGEAGGYVPEAATELGERFRAAHKVGWAARFFRWSAFYLGFVGLPFVMAVTSGMMKLVDTAVNGTQQTTPAQLLGTFVTTSVTKFFTSWPVIVLAVGCAVYFVSGWWLRQTAQRPLRHRWGYRLPVFGQFARQENLSVFSSHMERLSAAGISPRQSWELAARAVPNHEFSAMLQGALATTGHETPFSDIAARSGIVPPEQASLIRTGEMTGSLPDAFRHMALMARDSAQSWQRGRMYTLWLAAFLLCMLGGLVGAATFWAGYYNQVINSALQE
ncbi:MAG: type II secretion system F family protein [Fimbriimonadaceae bacterium]|nr:type II secretion system F family protein [Fimbriimonadaceae bacterium]